MAEPTSLKIVSAQTLDIDDDTAASGPIGTSNPGQPGRAEVVRLCATVECWVGLGDAGAILLPAGTAEYFDIPAGGVVSAVATTDAGTLSIALCRKN